MVKSSNALIPFNRDHLFITVYDSCRHRSSASEDASALTQIIISQLVISSTSGTIKREDIIRAVLQILGRFDATAAAVYAAYHPIRA